LILGGHDGRSSIVEIGAVDVLDILIHGDEASTLQEGAS